MEPINEEKGRAYLDLLKKVLTAYIYPESGNTPIVARSGLAPYAVLQRFALRTAKRFGLQLLKLRRFEPALRESGDDWPSFGYTMVGLKRLNNVQYAIETVLQEGIPGDVCECGVWRGGCSIFMRAVLKQHGCSDRVLWVADSFEGMPKPDAGNYPADLGCDLSQNEYLAVTLEMVQENFRRFDLLDDQVKFLKGWFKDTLPSAPIKQLSVLRADGDLYESTMTTLTSLYDKVAPGGFIIIDDYGTWEACKKAVETFRAKRNITDPIQRIDGCGVFWRKGRV